LSSADVTIRDTVTWGMEERIKGAMIGSFSMKGIPNSAEAAKDTDVRISGEGLFEAKIKTIEVFVEKIEEKNEDGTSKVVPFTRDWLENLSPADGKKLSDAIDAVDSETAGK